MKVRGKNQRVYIQREGDVACHVTIFGEYAVCAVCFLHRSICVSDRLPVRRSHRQRQGRQRGREAASLCGGRCGSKRVGGHRKPYPHIKGAELSVRAARYIRHRG